MGDSQIRIECPHADCNGSAPVGSRYCGACGRSLYGGQFRVGKRQSESDHPLAPLFAVIVLIPLALCVLVVLASISRHSG